MTKGEWMLLTESNSYPSVEELARPEPEDRKARINPANFAPSRQNFINNIWLKISVQEKNIRLQVCPHRSMQAISAGAGW